MGAKSEVAQIWANWLHNPCLLGGPHTKGLNQKWLLDHSRGPICEQIGYITPALHGDKNGPHRAGGKLPIRAVLKGSP